MKIIAIGRNYREHAKELNNPVPDEPVIFLKPDTAILKDNRDFYYPDFSKDIHYEAEIVLRISKEGKYISEKFAAGYFGEIGLGIDFTARDLQQKQKEKGLPWEIAKAFDQSAPVSSFVDKNSFSNLKELSFHLDINKKTVQKGSTADLLFSFEKIIVYASRFFTLRKGDLIFTGTPAGVGPVAIGDHLEGFIEDQQLLDFNVR